MVKLINISQSTIVTNGRQLSPEETIAYVARVSNPSNQENLETAPKLLKYLIKNKHWSPFELVSMCVEIETTRAIAQQILRHRSFSFQEFSQRYAETVNYQLYPARRQDTKNRQNSIDDLPKETRDWFYDAQIKVGNESFELYKKALELGIAKEQARFLLPLNTSTRLYMAGSVRSWLHYIDLRSANGTQKEHMDIARDIKNTIFIPNFPNIANAMEWL